MGGQNIADSPRLCYLSEIFPEILETLGIITSTQDLFSLFIYSQMPIMCTSRGQHEHR